MSCLSILCYSVDNIYASHAGHVKRITTTVTLFVSTDRADGELIGEATAKDFGRSCHLLLHDASMLQWVMRSLAGDSRVE
jgi:hypothetical protein